MTELQDRETRHPELLLWSSLVNLSHVASTARNFEEVYETLTTALSQFLSFDRLAIRLINEESNTVSNVFVSGAEMAGWQPGEVHILEQTTTADLVKTREPVIINRGYEPSSEGPAPLKASPRLPSLLAVPLVSRGKVHGAIYLRSHEEAKFGADDARLVEAFATHIAPAIENARHFDALEADVEERRVLVELGRTITSSLDIESVFERFAELVSQIVPYDRLVITTMNNDGNTYTVRFTDGLVLTSYSPGRVVELPGTVTGAAMESDAPTILHLDGTDEEEEILRKYPVVRPAADIGIRSLLAAPMVSEGRIIGTFHAQSRVPFAYGQKHGELIQQVAAFAASAIAKSDMMQLIARESTERQVLAEIGRIIGSTLDFGDVFERVATEIRKFVPADRLVITTVDQDAGTITDRYISGVQVPVWDSQREKELQGLPTEDVVKNRKPTITHMAEDFDGEYRVEGLAESRDVGLQSAMFAPLVSGDQVIGTISVKSYTSYAYSQADLDVLNAVALQIAGAVAASELYLETLRLADERARRLQAESDIRELQQVNQAKSEFLSTVSHELKTPLTSILAFTSVIRKNRNGDVSDRELKHLEVIKRNGEQLDRLISDLVDVSRLQANTINLEPSRFDLNGMMAEILESFEPILAVKSQRFKTSVPDRSILINADSDRVRQVISNLVSNASKYSASGTEVSVSARARNGSAYVVVQDQGIGLSEEDREQLFTAFFRADNEMTRAQPGTGLGLVIAKSIAELHHGDVTLESEPGAGSTFTFHLPQEYKGELRP